MARGQAAIEFLTTYGWALLVTLLSIGVLAYYGVMGGDRFVPEYCAFGPGLGCVEYAATDEAVLLGIQNNMAKTIGSATITIESDRCSNSPIVVNFNMIGNGDRLVLPGDTTYHTFPCTATTADNRVHGRMRVTYRLLDEDVDHTVEGEFKLRAS